MIREGRGAESSHGSSSKKEIKSSRKKVPLKERGTRLEGEGRTRKATFQVTKNRGRRRVRK